MKTSTTPKLLFYITKWLPFVFFTVIVGCKKVKNDFLIERAASTVQKSVADVLFSTAPDSELKITQLSSDKKSQRILIPINDNGSLKLFKYILMELSSEGNMFKIERVLTKTKIDKDDNLFNLPLANDGSLNYYDANASGNTSSKLLMKTKDTEVTFESVNNDLKDETSSNLAPICTGGYCIDHWWVIYDINTGQIYSIEYLGSDCYEGQCNGPGGGGGGSGGYPPPTCEQLTAVAGAIADNTYPASNLKFITESNVTAETREYTYQWICLINYGGWGLLSTEKGVHKKVNNRWQWESLTHVNVVKEGLTIGGSVEHTEVATPTIGIYNSGMTLAINLKFNIACVPAASIERNKTSQRIFNINEAPAIPY